MKYFGVLVVGLLFVGVGVAQAETCETFARGVCCTSEVGNDCTGRLCDSGVAGACPEDVVCAGDDMSEQAWTQRGTNAPYEFHGNQLDVQINTMGGGQSFLVHGFVSFDLSGVDVESVSRAELRFYVARVAGPSGTRLWVDWFPWRDIVHNPFLPANQLNDAAQILLADVPQHQTLALPLQNLFRLRSSPSTGFRIRLEGTPFALLQVYTSINDREAGPELMLCWDESQPTAVPSPVDTLTPVSLPTNTAPPASTNTSVPLPTMTPTPIPPTAPPGQCDPLGECLAQCFAEQGMSIGGPLTIGR